MNKTLPVIVFVLAILSGCGGDRKEPAELTGRIQGGLVQGMDFSTPTRSGSTDAQGNFVYLPGEAVTFSVGGIELGTVAGAADVSLFTVAGLTPPTTERALRRELDRAMRNNTPFTRASNMALLLIELDADGNPDNGLDLRNRRGTLSGAPLDLDLPVSAFEASLYRFVPDVTRNIPPWKPVAWLYGSIGLRVAVHAQARIDYQGTSQPILTSDTFTYYANGALASDGFDRSGNGLGRSQSRYEYDAMGRITNSGFEEDFEADDVIDRRRSTSYRFDAHGDLAEATQRVESPFPGETATQQLVELDRDRFGRITHEVVTLDRDNDSSIDERSTYEASYDARGNGFSATSSTDIGDDGHADITSVTTTTYDVRDRVLSRVDAFDDDADGSVDSINTSTYRYDSAATGPTQLIAEIDFDADGTTDWRAVYAWVYDRQGNALTFTYANEPLADGVTYYATSTASAFDRDRRVTERVRDEDADGDGIVDARQRDSLGYDDVGNTVEYLSDYDFGVDGTVDARYVEGSEYGAGGELLMTAGGFDFDGDGLSDGRSTATPTHVVLVDGVLQITQWFFRTRLSYVE